MASQKTGPPYASPIASIGGIPTVGVDVAICSVFIFLFVVAAAGHMTIFVKNRKRGHKFLMSGAMYGFCLARIATMVMRIVWAVYPDDVQVAMAAQILVSAGVIVLFIINLIFAQRIIRAAHPNFGWQKTVSVAFKVIDALIVVMLAMVITATVQSYYTLNPDIRKVDRDLQLTAGTYLMFVSFLPIPLVVFTLIVPRKTRLEKFGSGRWRSKITILLVSAVLLCLGASFRAGTSYRNPRPRASPAWYHAKWCFYFFNFAIETVVVYLYLLLRVDRRFHIPNGSKGAGDYSGGVNSEPGVPATRGSRFSMGSTHRVLSEEEVFDDEMPTGDEKSIEGQV
ncbi:hypothetical protein B0A52_08645 [Exophiala mesophila]|uniref:DUF7702 domain-containing protein n=1 Tax=Exophiala mesophila TaxID=212818 RepID=A0A438MTZ7_EXOME|nr:hypothetical protein B0A52_08645 [Exophiala mesophila]